MEKIIEKADDKDPYFSSSAEKKFLERVMEAYRHKDLEAFSDAVY